MLLHFKILFQWDYEMLHIWDHLQNCYILKLKLLHLWEYEKNCYFLKLKLPHLWRYLKNYVLFYLKCCISWEIYKFSTFSINYVKLKLDNQLLQGQFIVADVLMELDCLNLMRIFNFLDISQKHYSVNTFMNFRMC